MDFAAFGFEADVSFTRIEVETAGNYLAVDRQGSGSISAFDAIVVPLAGGIASSLVRERAHPATRMGFIRCHSGALNGKHITMTGRVFTIAAIQYLHFDGTSERLSRCR